MTTIENIQGFKSYYKNILRESSLYVYSKVLIRFLSWSKNDFENVTANDIAKYIKELKDKGCSSSHITVTMASLKKYVQYINDTADDTIISKFIFDKVVVPKISIAKKRPVTTYNALKYINALIEKRYKNEFSILQSKMLVIILLTTGVRRHELESLKLDDIDLTNNLIYFYKTKRDKPKVLFIPETTKEKIIEFLNLRKKYLIDNEFLLTSYRHNSKIEMFTNKARSVTNYLYLQLKKDIKDFTFHSLRRGFATDLANNGTSIYDISLLLGHESISTTLKCYVIRDSRAFEAIKNHPAYLEQKVN